MEATQEEIIRHVVESARSREAQTGFGVYADCVNVALKDSGYMRALCRPDAFPYADGMAVVWAARVLGGQVAERSATTDLFPRVCEVAALGNLRLFFLGAAPGVAERCARNMQAAYPGLQIAGVRDGFFQERDPQVIEEINKANADVLFVGLGMPKQEKWVDQHRHELVVPVVMTCGATFDFYSGRVRRAPQWMQRIGLEWLFRLALEPRRLWRRYLFGNAMFVWNVLRYRKASPTSQ